MDMYIKYFILFKKFERILFERKLFFLNLFYSFYENEE